MADIEFTNLVVFLESPQGDAMRESGNSIPAGLKAEGKLALVRCLHRIFRGNSIEDVKNMMFWDGRLLYGKSGTVD